MLNLSFCVSSCSWLVSCERFRVSQQVQCHGPVGNPAQDRNFGLSHIAASIVKIVYPGRATCLHLLLLVKDLVAVCCLEWCFLPGQGIFLWVLTWVIWFSSVVLFMLLERKSSGLRVFFKNSMIVLAFLCVCTRMCVFVCVCVSVCVYVCEYNGKSVHLQRQARTPFLYTAPSLF